MSGPLGRCSPVFEASQGIKAKISKQPSGTWHLKHHQGELGKMVWMAARWLELFLGSNENSNHANANVCFFSRGFVQKMNSDKVGDEMKT